MFHVKRVLCGVFLVFSSFSGTLFVGRCSLANSGVYVIQVAVEGGDAPVSIYGPAQQMMDKYHEIKNDLLGTVSRWVEIEGWGENPDRADKSVFVFTGDIKILVLHEY